MKAPGAACARILIAGLIAAALCAPAGAEIRRIPREGGEVVATNLPARTPLRKGAGARSAAEPAPTPVLAPPGMADLLVKTSARYGFDPALIRAVIVAESAFDPMAVSRKGARGLMQLMPSTARRFGVRNVHDPAANIEAGVAYLRELTISHEGRVDLALAAYNAGPDAVARHGGVPPYRETREYLERIRRQYGADLSRADWSGRESRIRVASVDRGGVPHFTNVSSRRIIGPGTASVRPAGAATDTVKEKR